jgi:dGTP triphosphohydrolase
MSEKQAQKIIDIVERDRKKVKGKTSITAYRRVHEIVASSLDEVSRVLNSFRSTGYASQEQTNNCSQEIARLSLLVSRALIIVKYQESREQISFSISDALVTMLNTLLSRLQRLVNQCNAKEITETLQITDNIRLLIDAIAVLVYMYGRKKG